MSDEWIREEPDEAVEDDTFKVEDKRHWSSDDADEAASDGADDSKDSGPIRQPSIIDEYRERTEAAETKLHEYIEAFKAFRAEQDEVRVRLRRDVDRRAEARFGELVGDLFESLDHLDLALQHAARVPEAAPLAQGVQLARDGFLNTLLRAGVERIHPDGQEFDPNEAEALRLDPVGADQHNKVTETIQAGYRLGEKVIRPARVAVGKQSG